MDIIIRTAITTARIGTMAIIGLPMGTAGTATIVTTDITTTIGNKPIQNRESRSEAGSRISSQFLFSRSRWRQLERVALFL
jgi:hypothetical protein